MYMFKAMELPFDINGLRFDCIYGLHTNGGWCAITNFGVSCELSAYSDDIYYNTQKIFRALSHSPEYAWLPEDDEARKKIAAAIATKLTRCIQAMKDNILNTQESNSAVNCTNEL